MIFWAPNVPTLQPPLTFSFKYFWINLFGLSTNVLGSITFELNIGLTDFGHN